MPRKPFTHSGAFCHLCCALHVYNRTVHVADAVVNGARRYMLGATMPHPPPAAPSFCCAIGQPQQLAVGVTQDPALFESRKVPISALPERANASIQEIFQLACVPA